MMIAKNFVPPRILPLHKQIKRCISITTTTFTILSFTPKHRAEKVIDRKRNGIPGVKPRGISSPPPPPPMFACLLVAVGFCVQGGRARETFDLFSSRFFLPVKVLLVIMVIAVFFKKIIIN